MEFDRAKVEVSENIPPPISVKGVQSFLGHAGFYRRFIQRFFQDFKAYVQSSTEGDEICIR